MALDPICKMEVDKKTATKTTYNGRAFYFCSASCLETFNKNPAGYTK